MEAVKQKRGRTGCLWFVIVTQFLVLVGLGFFVTGLLALGASFRAPIQKRHLGQDEYPEMREVWSCGSGQTKVVTIPLRGMILLEEESGFLPVRVGTAGMARDFEAYLRWSSRLARYDLEAGRRVGDKHLRYIFQGALPQCAELPLHGGVLPVPARGDADDPATFCAWMGRVALGCSDQAYSMLPYGLRLGMVFPAFTRGRELPWADALRAARDAPREQCLLPEG